MMFAKLRKRLRDMADIARGQVHVTKVQIGNDPLLGPLAETGQILGALARARLHLKVLEIQERQDKLREIGAALRAKEDAKRPPRTQKTERPRSKMTEDDILKSLREPTEKSSQEPTE